ncbi:MAG TPA: DUF2283 domain-containing protein [Thermoleophilaceae bacterium]|nr:DUF2283 domain-containing protein [Thermoleophilaceae bacterium]
MEFNYDPEANMAYLQLARVRPRSVANTVVIEDADLPGDLAVDLDAKGHILGIEIFDARRSLDPTMLGER